MCYAATLDGARCGCATCASLRTTSLGANQPDRRHFEPAAQFRKRGDASGDPEGAQLSEAKMSTYGVATRQDPSKYIGTKSWQQLGSKRFT